MRYTKQQILDAIQRNARFDIQAGENCELNEITIQVFSDEPDYELFCKILKISKKAYTSGEKILNRGQ